MGQINQRENGGLSTSAIWHMFSRAQATLTREQFEKATVRGHLTLGGKLKEIILEFEGEEQWPPPNAIWPKDGT